MLNIQFNFAEEWFSEEDFKEIGGNSMVVELTEAAQKRLEKMAINKIKNEVKGEVREELREELRDEVKGVVREELREEVKEEFKEETEGNIVKKLLEDGFKVEEVLKYTSLNKSQVIALSNAIVLK